MGGLIGWQIGFDCHISDIAKGGKLQGDGSQWTAGKLPWIQFSEWVDLQKARVQLCSASCVAEIASGEFAWRVTAVWSMPGA